MHIFFRLDLGSDFSLISSTSVTRKRRPRVSCFSKTSSLLGMRPKRTSTCRTCDKNSLESGLEQWLLIARTLLRIQWTRGLVYLLGCLQTFGSDLLSVSARRERTCLAIQLLKGSFTTPPLDFVQIIAYLVGYSTLKIILRSLLLLRRSIRLCPDRISTHSSRHASSSALRRHSISFEKPCSNRALSKKSCLLFRLLKIGILDLLFRTFKPCNNGSPVLPILME